MLISRSPSFSHQLGYDVRCNEGARSVYTPFGSDRNNWEQHGDSYTRCASGSERVWYKYRTIECSAN